MVEWKDDECPCDSSVLALNQRIARHAYPKQALLHCSAAFQILSSWFLTCTRECGEKGRKVRKSATAPRSQATSSHRSGSILLCPYITRHH